MSPCPVVYTFLGLRFPGGCWGAKGAIRHMRILLVQPHEFRPGFNDYLWLLPPLPLETVAAHVVAHHDVRILDLRLVGDDTRGALHAALEEFQPHVVGATSLTLTVVQAFEVLEAAKHWNPQVITVLGGRHATFEPEWCLWPFVDVVIQGEGDATFPELIAYIDRHWEARGRWDLSGISGVWSRDAAGEPVAAPPRALAQNLSALPFPARHLSADDAAHYRVPRNIGQPTLFIEASRGCMFNCKFCTVPTLYGQSYRAWHPERIVEQLAANDAPQVCFSDDNFLNNPDDAMALADAIIRSGLSRWFFCTLRCSDVVNRPDVVDKWAEAGLGMAYMGFEDYVLRRLRAVGARKSGRANERAVAVLRERGIEPVGSFIVNPNFTHEDFDDLEAYVCELDVTTLTFYVLTPYPGTEIYSELRDQVVEWDYRLWDSYHTVLRTHLPPEEFYHRYRRLFRKFWSSVDRSGMVGQLPAGMAMQWYRNLASAATDAEQIAHDRPPYALGPGAALALP